MVRRVGLDRKVDPPCKIKDRKGDPPFYKNKEVPAVLSVKKMRNFMVTALLINASFRKQRKKMSLFDLKITPKNTDGSSEILSQTIRTSRAITNSFELVLATRRAILYLSKLCK